MARWKEGKAKREGRKEGRKEGEEGGFWGIWRNEVMGRLMGMRSEEYLVVFS